MQALVQHRYGGPEVLALEDIPRPEVGPGQVLLRVRAAGLNAADWRLMRARPGLVRLFFGFSRPRIPTRGMDVAGVVAEVAPGVTELKVGDEVFGWGEGILAEYAVVKQENLRPKPANLSFEEASTLGIAAFTALQAVRDKARVQPGQRVLINGAAGGVGHFTVQIAKAYGAEVTAVCSGRNAELVRSLGADRVVDYAKDDFVAGAIEHDVLIDVVGNRSLAELRRALTPTGTLVLVGARNDDPSGGIGRNLKAALLNLFSKQRLVSFVARENRPDLMVLEELALAGKLRPAVARVHEMREAQDALRALEAGHVAGKLVVAV
ncbi:MAG: NAD(P)-dependent alcohol dehydrogenase [Deltaproteobacteria bacterium]|nr:NAD(P)-dependent alcohol dehydrogenase [Deltaproteobacteria bacterium]